MPKSLESYRRPRPRRRVGWGTCRDNGSRRNGWGAGTVAHNETVVWQDQGMLAGSLQSRANRSPVLTDWGSACGFLASWNWDVGPCHPESGRSHRTDRRWQTGIQPMYWAILTREWVTTRLRHTMGRGRGGLRLR